ncbi:sugar ABC transporter substrate-binding protein [Conexibacter sp. JD483]|uniref:ABC transporter substrate-binding protein n=1 Tax=unclassified Conexibacter TaxID=2627773 RepID=UPI0027187A8B|nr:MULTISPECIES: sugar ABC transporter substrate-binding protein [unclassified Conexibacter]MDO8184201.1 sugar ABC transporter substrate-binding protein [Conexibacter sp. CPCC 205706]MDO8197193.1 sugar ABC transporter substrate-binding protein [Conexibacter sp. CPCC 205762]MDR9367492.1 sugar ABC transporter substrate-binding protein [Conexibacter sp. JD483]
MDKRYVRILAVAASAAISMGTLAACGSDDDSNTTSTASGGAASTTGGGGSTSGKIALLLPENKTARYESQDRPLFEAQIRRLCPDCEVIYSNAEQDASQQQQQAEAAITNGARVLVLDPVDGRAAAAIATRAKQSNIGVIAYDRAIENADVDYYISFDNARVGELQAQALVDKLRRDGRTGDIVMINGAPTDPNAALFKRGAHSVFDTAEGIRIGKEYDTPDWSPDRAQTEMEQAITALGRNNFVGVYAANDGTAGGAIAAMRSNGIDPATRPTTGQDAELAGIQRIVAGQQYMTIYKAIKPEAEDAAQLAVDLLNGRDSSIVNQRVNNGMKDVPSVILDPVPVTAENIRDTVVRDGFWTVQQICTSAYASACRRLGLQ